MKRKPFYQLTTLEHPKKWWDGRKWRTNEESAKPHKGLDSHRNLGNDSKKAWKIFNKMPKGYILMKWYYIKGVRYLAEWQNY